MKRIISILLTALLLLSVVAVLPAFADETVTGQTDAPEWIITEIANDSAGNDTNTNGYLAVNNQDTFEFIEIYNNSGRELNLYEYALTYESATRDSGNFENRITESTPIKGGDYLDGSNLVPDEGQAVFGDLSLKPVNPDTCQVAPGEVVVLWMVYYESYLAEFNDGKGLSVEDFRAHWDVPEGVKVIAVDANSSAKNGGNGKNFNVKNSAVGTYGIAKQSPELEAGTNVKDAPKITGSYTESEHLVFWATMDFNDMLMNGSAANATYSFTWDFAGYAAVDQSYTYIRGEDYTYDARRGLLLTMYDQPTVGTLNTVQKMTLGVELAEGESFTLDESRMYYPWLEEDITGFKINGEFYDDNATFTATAAGVYTFDYFFKSDEVTEAPTEEPTEPETTVVEYTVSFEISGYPFEQPAAVTVIAGSCIEAPPVELPDDGSRFDGWYTASDCNADSKFDFSTPITDNMTLYAALTPAETATEMPTDAPVEATTDAPADGTDAPVEGGCGSTLGLVMLPCLAAVAWVYRKREA